MNSNHFLSGISIEILLVSDFQESIIVFNCSSFISFENILRSTKLDHRMQNFYQDQKSSRLAFNAERAAPFRFASLPKLDAAFCQNPH